MNKKKALKRLGLLIVLGMLAVLVFVWLMDPFYQYHKPYFGLQAVLYDRDNQVAGSLRNFDYNAVLLGSSVAENFDTEYLDAQYGCQTIKAVRASGSVADLLYYMDVAHANQEIQQVFWCMDIFALMAEPEVTLYGEDVPRYLHTETILDDIPYLFNKEILFEKIPMMVVYSLMDRNTGGQAYDWSQDKEFSSTRAMTAYEKPAEVVAEQDFTEIKAQIQANIDMVMEEITSHPEIKYTIIFPPYSMLWWDCGYVNGMGEQYFYVLEQTLPQLLECENARVYYYQAEQEIICNLDNYMDMIHYAPWVNQYMLESIVTDKGRVTKENQDQVVENMRGVYDYIVGEGIYLYYEKK